MIFLKTLTYGEHVLFGGSTHGKQILAVSLKQAVVRLRLNLTYVCKDMELVDCVCLRDILIEC